MEGPWLSFLCRWRKIRVCAGEKGAEAGAGGWRVPLFASKVPLPVYYRCVTRMLHMAGA